ncbi:hypothetical protein BC827DRAFT_758095 [Russula dissimulans]|nr:hypothetical protein BC827DRAFT_758095 [Russula dissimulans]
MCYERLNRLCGSPISTKGVHAGYIFAPRRISDQISLEPLCETFVEWHWHDALSFLEVWHRRYPNVFCVHCNDYLQCQDLRALPPRTGIHPDTPSILPALLSSNLLPTPPLDVATIDASEWGIAVSAVSSTANPDPNISRGRHQHMGNRKEYPARGITHSLYRAAAPPLTVMKDPRCPLHPHPPI